MMSNPVLLILIIVSLIDIASSISCYKCLSVNGSNPSCEDPFQGDIIGKPSLLSSTCLTHLRGRSGLFPATHCIKLVAYSRGPKPVQYMYRTCGLEEADHNGIIRASHCGFVKLKWIDSHRRFRGCLEICDRDACNRAWIDSISRMLFYFLLLIFFSRANGLDILL